MKLRTIQHLHDASEEDIREAVGHVQFVPKIEAYLEDLNLEPNNRSLGVFSASDLGNKTGRSLCGKYPIGCARLLYYRYILVEPQSSIPPRLRRIFDTGHGVHEQLQGYLMKISGSSEQEFFADEVEFDGSSSQLADEYEIKSTADGVWEIESSELDLRYGLEIKSMNGDLFKNLNGPDQHHVVQSHVYMACLDLPFMVILYYNKNDSSMSEYVVKFDYDIWHAVTEKINYVRECAVKEEDPEREVGFHCRTCRYSYICKPPKPQRKNIRMGRKRFSLRGR